ncbi:MAG: GNAT family N-acetyltransferase, partial [Alphaproteobacteria bacterium]
MKSPENIPGVEFGPMAAGEHAAVRDLIADTFSRYEPMAVAAGQTYAEFQALVGLLAAETTAQDLTIRARLTATGEIVGVMLTTDFTTPMPDGMDELSPGFAPIGGLLAQLENWYQEAKSPQPGECLDLAMLAVDRAHGGKGIAQNLVRACLDNGAAQGYRSAVT